MINCRDGFLGNFLFEEASQVFMVEYKELNVLKMYQSQKDYGRGRNFEKWVEIIFEMSFK